MDFFEKINTGSVIDVGRYPKYFSGSEIWIVDYRLVFADLIEVFSTLK